MLLHMLQNIASPARRRSRKATRRRRQNYYFAAATGISPHVRPLSWRPSWSLYRGASEGPLGCSFGPGGAFWGRLEPRRAPHGASWGRFGPS
eukprot:4506328-Pyramimonas_sp.AAC.1